jgi:DNA adenine methylase
MKYNGGKNGSGVYQRIICMIPPHDVYIELFLGSGAILRRKRPAALSYGYELNAESLNELVSHIPPEFGEPGDMQIDATPDLKRRIRHLTWFDAETGSRPTLTLSNADGLAALRDRYSAGSAFWLNNDPARTVIYADPPYLLETRKTKTKLYQFEMFERAQHKEFLDLAAACPAKMLISAYENPLYNSKLKHWRKEQIATTNRAGDRVIETVYLNYPEPFELHDYSHVGADYRERWRITKKVRRWEQNFRNTPTLERYAILGRLNEIRAEYAAQENERDTKAANDRKRIASRREKQLKPRTTPPPALGSLEQDLFE